MMIIATYYGPGCKGRSPGNHDDQSRSHNRSLSPRGPGSVIFVNTVRAYTLGGPMATKNLPVPIMNGMPHITMNFIPPERKDPYAPVLD